VRKVKTFNSERGFSTGSRAGESGNYEQLAEVFFHGPLVEESGNHVCDIHV
jgi:hypothetical protein